VDKSRDLAVLGGIVFTGAAAKLGLDTGRQIWKDAQRGRLPLPLSAAPATLALLRKFEIKRSKDVNAFLVLAHQFGDSNVAGAISGGLPPWFRRAFQ
jgi:hypothetical protein